MTGIQKWQEFNYRAGRIGFWIVWAVLMALGVGACLTILFTDLGCKTGNTVVVPQHSLVLQGETLVTTLNALSDARDQHLITQAELNTLKPVVDVYLSARAKAEAQIAVGQDPTTVNNLIAQANSAWSKAAPIVLDLLRRKPTTKPT